METDLVESNALFIATWSLWARRVPTGEVRELPGLTAAWSRVSLPLCNGTFLKGPVEDEDDLNRRIEAALAYAEKGSWPWLFFVCTDWLPEPIRPRAAEVFSRHGLVPGMESTGMATDALRPAREDLPRLEYRRVGDPETRRAASDLNCVSYEMPLEWGYEALDHEAMWDETTFGYVGYQEGKPVTTSVTYVVDGRLYVALVATSPEHRGQGCAEAVMQHSLAQAREASGVERTVLHATPAGLSLYRKMGYRDVAGFVAFTAA